MLLLLILWQALSSVTTAKISRTKKLAKAKPFRYNSDNFLQIDKWFH